MGQKLSECFGRTLIINEIRQCNNPGMYFKVNVDSDFNYKRVVDMEY